MKYCASCGQCLSDNCDVCPVCGHGAEDATNRPETAYEAEKYVRSGVKYSYVKPKLTIAFIIINVLVYLIINGLELMGCDLASVLSMHRGSVMSGQYYRILTSVFTHRELFHLLSNCYALYIYGMMLEPAMGKWRYIAVYFTSGILGNLLTFAFIPNSSIGASGAIFGLLGAIVAIYFINPTSMNRDLMKAVLVCVVITTIYSFTGGINNFAHFGGLFGGFMMTCISVKGRRVKRLITSRVLMSVVLIICVAGSIFIGSDKVLSANEKQFGNWSVMCFLTSFDKYDEAETFAEKILSDEDGAYSPDAAAVKIVLAERRNDAKGLEEHSEKFLAFVEKGYLMLDEKIYNDLTAVKLK